MTMNHQQEHQLRRMQRSQLQPHHPSLRPQTDDHNHAIRIECIVYSMIVIEVYVCIFHCSVTNIYYNI